MNEHEKLNDEMKQNSLIDRNRNLILSNETDNQLSGQLMLLCTVFLTVAFVVVGNSQSLTNTSTVTKVLVLQVLVLTFASIGCGIKNYFTNIKYYGTWAKQSHKNYQLFIENDFKNQVDLVKKYNNNLSELEQQSNTFWLNLQIISLATAVFLLLTTITLILF